MVDFLPAGRDEGNQLDGFRKRENVADAFIQTLDGKTKCNKTGRPDTSAVSVLTEGLLMLWQSDAKQLDITHLTSVCSCSEEIQPQFNQQMYKHLLKQQVVHAVEKH